MSIKEGIRLLGAIVFFFGSLQGISQSAATRSQEVASHARQAKEFLKEQRPDLAIPEFRAIVALDPNIIKRLNKDSLAILGRARSTRSCSFQKFSMIHYWASPPSLPCSSTAYGHGSLAIASTDALSGNSPNIMA